MRGALEAAGLLCLSVYVSTRAFIAFGPLVHTDVAVTLFSLLTLWRFAEVWQNPRRKNALVFSLSLAGALLSKFTASILFFAFVSFCSEHALARCAWPAHCQTRGACLAPASLARHSSGHSLGCPYR